MITRRRSVLALGLAALSGPWISFGQQKQASVYRIGFLGLTSASEPTSVARLQALRAGLSDYGYREGQNFVFEFRWADANYARLQSLAADLVRSKVDVIVPQGTPGAKAAKQATPTIPIVMPAVANPVATGLVADLARPGANLTGSTFFDTELMAKRLGLLKEAVPTITDVGVLVNPNNALFGPALQEMQVAGRSLNVRVHEGTVRASTDLEPVFASLAKVPIQGLVINEDSLLIANRHSIADLAKKHRIPSAGGTEFVEVGALFGYGVDILALYRRAAYFIDKILKGAKPSELPVERATTFDFVINLRTARDLHIKIPQSMLARASAAIE